MIPAAQPRDGLLRALLDRFLWRLAWRNVWRNGRRTAIVVSAVAVGIAGVILSMAINYGMVIQLVENAIATELGHIQVHAPGFADEPGLDRRLVDGARREREVLAGIGAVSAWAVRVRSQGLISSPRASAGVRVMAIEPEREAHITRIERSITRGDYLDGEPRRILLGEALAQRLHVDVGGKVVLSAQDVHGDLAGEAFRVGGLFRTASLDLDRTTVYVRLQEAQALLALDADVSELVVLAEARSAIPGVRDALRARLGDAAEVQTWEELQPLLVYMVDMFEQMAWIVYAAVFVAMAFGIANVLLMAVFERTREIGVMRSIGMSGSRVVVLVVLESSFLTLLGLLLGFALALASVWLLRDGIDLSRWGQGLNAFGVGSTIVPTLRVGDFTTPTGVALVTAVVASLWPALRAVRARPADALRHF